MLKLELRNGGLSGKLNGFEPYQETDNFLSRHGIKDVNRGRMVDWMYEVLTIYKMSE